MGENLLKKLYAQHTDLVGSLEEIKNMSAASSFSFVSIKLRAFSKLLIGHIHLENTSLYPEIFESIKNDKVAIACAKKVLEDMKSIQDETINFLNRYNDEKKIRRNLKKFRCELERIISILQIRIRLEEDVIYQYHQV